MFNHTIKLDIRTGRLRVFGEDGKEILYFDMDGPLVDFDSGCRALPEADRILYEGRYDQCPAIFELMQPTEGAIDAFLTLREKFDCYVLSTPPWDNPVAWKHKIEWIHRNFGADQESPAHKRLVLSHHKHLNLGSYLIDDRSKNGADRFAGEHILFGGDKFPGWNSILDYLLSDRPYRDLPGF